MSGEVVVYLYVRRGGGVSMSEEAVVYLNVRRGCGVS
jgi:hypothetical protein